MSTEIRRLLDDVGEQLRRAAGEITSPGEDRLIDACLALAKALCLLASPPGQEAPQDDLHDAAMAIAYDDADEWATGYFTDGYKANLLASRIEELVTRYSGLPPVDAQGKDPC